jgi:hypothetical protein
MLDKFVDNSLKSLLETLTKSGLPKDKVNKIYTHYRELTLNETKKCKQASESPAEIIDHMKKFGKEIAVEAMADDYEELARYHIDNFATSAKIQLVDRLAYYYDNLKLDATSQDNVIPLLTEILEYDNQPINGNTINEILKQANLNSLQGKEINYELTAKIQSFDDEHNLVDIIFYIKDLIHLDNKGKPIVKKASKVFQFYLPYSPIQENKLIADDLKHYQFNFVKNVTFANWGGVIETIKTVTDSKNFPIDVKKKEPITDLISSMSTIFTVDNKPLKDHKIFQKYSFKLNVYGYDEKTNAIDFEVIVSMPNDNTIHDSQSSQEY